jgi:hypothetical protein
MGADEEGEGRGSGRIYGVERREQRGGSEMEGDVWVRVEESVVRVEAPPGE